MLLPRFTIRTLLVILTASAAVFVIVGAAVRGHYWAWGVTIAIFSLLVTAVVHAAWFSVVKLMSRMSTPPPDVAGLRAAGHLPGDVAIASTNDQYRSVVPPTTH
jgi:hypothetical protein